MSFGRSFQIKIGAAVMGAEQGRSRDLICLDAISIWYAMFIALHIYETSNLWSLSS